MPNIIVLRPKISVWWPAQYGTATPTPNLLTVNGREPKLCKYWAMVAARARVVMKSRVKE